MQIIDELHEHGTLQDARLAIAAMDLKVMHDVLKSDDVVRFGKLSEKINPPGVWEKID